MRVYAQTAYAVINLLRDKLLSPYASYVETNDEIETTHDPVGPLPHVSDDCSHKKVRFEAKCKLMLMNLAGAIDQREITHEEYKMKRIFDSGVAKFLFPGDIYTPDMERIRRALLYQFR
ncbi:MAG: hypothetical protein H6935_09585 [Thiobacillus sp.]|nr:hypothetical protein [Thiobacillus sp.]